MTTQPWQARSFLLLFITTFFVVQCAENAVESTAANRTAYIDRAMDGNFGKENRKEQEQEVGGEKEALEKKSSADTKKASFVTLWESSEFLFLINEGSKYTNMPRVSLNIKAPTNAEKMYITNTPNCSDGGQFEEVVTAKEWTLDDSQRNKLASVYVKFAYLDSEEESECLSASIIHDDIPPSPVLNLQAKYDTPQKKLQFSWEVAAVADSSEQDLLNRQEAPVYVDFALGKEAGKDGSLPWSEVSEANTASVSFADSVATGASYYLSVRSRDEAGNISTEIPNLKFFAYSPVESLSLGEVSSCAIFSDKQVKCWGYNHWGSLGQDDKINRGAKPDEIGINLKPISFASGFTAKQLTGGQQFHCALSEEGSVLCWGYNEFGQLGQGDVLGHGSSSDPSTSMKTLKPIQLGTSTSGQPLKAKQVSAGFNHVCALLENDEVKCWGRNLSGELGLGDKANRGDQPNEMGDNLLAVNLNLNAGEKVVSVEGGRSFTCALTSLGQVKCWGFNWSGDLGVGSSKSYGDGTNPMAMLPAVDLGFASDGLTPLKASRVFANTFSNHACAVMAANQGVKCWGGNNRGQLGYGSTSNMGATALTMGNNLLFVNLGVDSSGQALKAEKLSLGYEFTCALLSDTSVRCWGVEGFGTLGWNFPGRTAASLLNVGDQPDEMGDKLKSLDFGAGNVAQTLVSGGGHSCFLLQDKTVKCFGYNEVGSEGAVGQLGLGSSPNRSSDELSTLPRLEL